MSSNTEYVLSKVDTLINWARQGSLWLTRGCAGVCQMAVTAKPQATYFEYSRSTTLTRLLALDYSHSTTRTRVLALD